MPWSAHLYNIISVHWGFWAFVKALFSSHHSISNRLRSGLLTGPSLYLCSFLFQPFCWCVWDHWTLFTNMSVELFLPCVKNNCVCKVISFMKHVTISVFHMFVNHNYSEPVGVRNLHAICEKVWLKKRKQFCTKRKSERSSFP